MALGAFAAIGQQNIKRLMAYLVDRSTSATPWSGSAAGARMTGGTWVGIIYLVIYSRR
jgi:formate hydrogenlyase subunit 3/multisubunit Na+/H+ antiporter MnhD subunit